MWRSSIGLPELDGYQVAQQIRARMDADPLPRLIAMSGYGRPEDRHRARSAGFDLHLIKPESLSTLQEILVTIATTRRGTAPLVVEPIVT
jgi:two-component system CheB/CheR fusion protein